MSNKINVFDYCQLNPITGYGKMELGIVGELIKRDIEVAFPKIINDDALVYMNGINELGSKIALNSLISGNNVNLCFGNPVSYKMDGFNVLFTMSESTRVGEGWVSRINNNYNVVLVPCLELVEVYEKSGIKIPVHFVPLGLDFQGFPKFFDRKTRTRKTFVFLTYSYGDIRKGADLAVLAFKQAFQKDKTKELWIKCRTTYGNWLSRFEDEQVRVFEGDYTEKQWHQLLNKSDAFVFPTRGEGYGLPPREAALTGLPTMATEFLGTGDIAQWGIPIKVEAMRPALFEAGGANSKIAEWAMPDVENMKLMMQDIVDNKQIWLHHNEEVAIPYLCQFTWENTVNKLFEILRTYGYRYD